MPVAALGLQLLEGDDHTLPAGSPHRKLHGHDGQAQHDQEKQVNKHERRAAVLAHAVREHPDVAHAHGGADRGKDEADAVFEIGRLVLLHEKAFLSAAAELRPAAV